MTIRNTLCLCILAGIVALPLLAHAQPRCTLAWDAPATYTDGSPILAPVRYRVYRSREPGGYAESAAEVEGTTWQTPCLVGEYFVVTALVPSGQESAWSNEVQARDVRIPEVPGLHPVVYEEER